MATSYKYLLDQKQIKLWNCGESRWQMQKTLLPPHYDGVTAVAVSPKNQKFYSVSRDKSIKEWDSLTLENRVQQLHAHNDWITCCSLNSAENLLFTGGKDSVIKVWNPENLACLDALTGHTGPINQVLCVNDYLFSASHDRTVRVWKLEDPY